MKQNTTTNENTKFENHYECPCGTTWVDVWDSMCDDRCPSCNTSCSPTESIEVREKVMKTKNTAKTRTFTFFSDPGHGWLKVKRSDLTALNITALITACSYVRGDFVYLEEDCDATSFIKAMKRENWSFKIKESNAIRSSKIRSYERFEG